MTLSFGAVLAGFLYSDTMNWSSAVAKSFGRIPRDSVLGGFPVDINLTVQLIILTELLLFGGAFAMYFAIRVRFAVWPPIGAPILDEFIPRIQTLILISSSVLIEWAIWQLKQGSNRAFKAGLIGTTILGGLFPILQFGYEWPRLLFNGILTPCKRFLRSHILPPNRNSRRTRYRRSNCLCLRGRTCIHGPILREESWFC